MKPHERHTRNVKANKLKMKQESIPTITTGGLNEAARAASARGKLTDAQLHWLFAHRLSHHNGFSCNRRLTENGAAGTERICDGRATILNGKLKVHGGCHEPCSYICEDTRDLAMTLNKIVSLDELIMEAKRECKD